MKWSRILWLSVLATFVSVFVNEVTGPRTSIERVETRSRTPSPVYRMVTSSGTAVLIFPVSCLDNPRGYVAAYGDSDSGKIRGYGCAVEVGDVVQIQWVDGQRFAAGREAFVAVRKSS